MSLKIKSWTYVALCMVGVLLPQDMRLHKILPLVDVKKNHQITEEFLTLMQSSFGVQSLVEHGAPACELRQFSANTIITRFMGETVQLLPEMIQHARNMGRILFLLDGYYSACEHEENQTNIPLIEQLIVIKNSGVPSAIILIDNVAEYPPTRKNRAVGQEYPLLPKIKEMLMDINPDYVVVTYGDVLLAYPAATRIQHSILIEAMTASRFFDPATKTITIEATLLAEDIISKISGPEREALMTLTQEHPEYRGSYYNFWYGLTLFADQKFEQARTYLEKAREHGFDTDWRYWWYLAKIYKGLCDEEQTASALNKAYELEPRLKARTW